ncbi:MAG: heme biosynthesis HemY N-terminal domain-containing protein, partial [Pseudomonadota bacterium]
MILRILIFILTAVFFAFVVNGLGQINDELLIEILGQKIAMPTGFAFGSIAVATVIIILMTSFAKDIFALPGKIRARREKAKLERGMTAVARGMEAVAIGDATDATHHAKVAQRTLGQGSITRLLTAQAAQLSGDDEVAGESFEAMLEAPETEFLGLRGLYGKAERNGDKEAARKYAERAYRLRPNAAWAFQAVFDLALERGAWGDARASLGPAQKNKSIGPEKAQRAEAALLAASAHAADTSEDVSTALEEAELALKHAPGLAPAAVLAARLHHNGKKTQRGVKILEQAFAAHAHPSLVATLIELTAGANDKASVEALRKLA